MSDKNVKVIKYIQATGHCPKNDIMATSMYSESGYQPKVGKKFDIKKSIDTNPPLPTKGSSAVHPTERVEVEIDYSDSLFDPNEKDPAMRALNMVKEYCRVSIDHLTDYDFSISEFNHKREAYVDVISFIADHQRKCKAAESSEVPKSEEIKHFANEKDWFEKKMREYRDSFFRVCDIVEHSDCADIIKKLVEEERKRY